MRDTTTKQKGINHWIMLDVIERKIRLRTERLCDERGPGKGRRTFEDWLKAQSEALRTLNAG